MNDERERIPIGHSEDIDKNSVENFEHEDFDYAIFNIDGLFYATQGNCFCEEQALISEGTIDGDEIECSSCSRTFNIHSGDNISDPTADRLKIYEISEENGSLYLII